MTKMRALVVGCSGVAVEIVKNLVLQGLGAVTLVDPKPAKIQDLGTNFFLSEADVGKPLAALLVPKFQELNPFCDVCIADALTAEVVQQHTVLLICESMPLTELLKWNAYCRTLLPKPVAFLYVRTGGVFGNVFVDFGPSHVLVDANGQAPMVRLVESIDSGPEALVRLSIPDGQAPGSLPEGCYVEFSDVQGCEGIDAHQELSPCGEKVTAWKISSKPNDPVNSIRIGDTSGFSPYKSGGLVTEKKVGVPYPFKSLAETLKDPGMPFDTMVGTDMINFGAGLQRGLSSVRKSLCHRRSVCAAHPFARLGDRIGAANPRVAVCRAHPKSLDLGICLYTFSTESQSCISCISTCLFLIFARLEASCDVYRTCSHFVSQLGAQVTSPRHHVTTSPRHGT
ncbi:Ubiquitin-activating enzyme E1 1 (Poly(A)+ RNA transport protein 3) [Durusdinium trenchii]